MSLQGKTVVLGICGGIAAYKMCELASHLTQSGVRVPVVMTVAAQQFVAPLTFAALTGQAVHTSLWPSTTAGKEGVAASMAHINLAETADAILIAPATADIVARLAHGLADDLLTTLVLAAAAPILLAPSMNPHMYRHPAVEGNLQRLRAYGYHVLEPDSGRMACHHVGPGRLPPTERLVEFLLQVLAESTSSRRDGPLTGKQVLITAGPTREALDPVRYLSNRSSGRMGYALAAEAAARGAQTILVSGPTSLPCPHGVQRIEVTTVQEMLETCQQHAPPMDIIIGAAAVADFRPVTTAAGKIKKSSLKGRSWKIEVEPAPDVIATLAAGKKPHQLVIGFAAETEALWREARRKLQDKQLDAIVANDVSQPDAGFEVETNRVTWITPATSEEWPLLSKTQVAQRILDRLTTLLEPGREPSGEPARESA